MKKKILVIVAIIVGIIFLDSLQAFIFNNNPLLSIKKYQNGGNLNYISKGLIIDTYNCSNGKKDATIKGFSYSCSKAKESNYKIVDTSKDIDCFACNQVLEEIYRDDKYIYYLPCEKSKYIKVIYNENNYQESLKSSLKEGYIHISELDKFDIEYIKKELAEMWKLETEQVVIRDVNTDIIKEQIKTNMLTTLGFNDKTYEGFSINVYFDDQMKVDIEVDMDTVEQEALTKVGLNFSNTNLDYDDAVQSYRTGGFTCEEK